VEELYSILKYCGPNALSFPFPPNDELNLATELNDNVSPADIDDVITCLISYVLFDE